MKKLLNLVVLIFAGCIVAGLYGILHDQLTYTISPEYYTKFKFYQFGLLEAGEQALTSPRLYAGFVGFRATWWMGIPIGAALGLFALHSDRRFMTEIAMKAFVVTIVIAFATALYGLYDGFVYLADQPRARFVRWYIPEDLIDWRSFIAVGSMHNHSYMGGIYGLLGGIAYITWRKHSRRRVEQLNSAES